MRVLNCFVDTYVAHAVWIVWHRELCDVKRNAFCLYICEFYYSAGFINMGNFIRRKSFAMLFECQSKRCLHTSACCFARSLFSWQFGNYSLFLNSSITFLIFLLEFTFRKNFAKRVGEKFTFMFLRPLGAICLVIFSESSIIRSPFGCCFNQFVDVWLILATVELIS